MKEGNAPTKFYFIINGEVDVICCYEDFEYYDEEKAEKFIDPDGVNKKKTKWWKIVLHYLLRKDERKLVKSKTEKL